MRCILPILMEKSSFTRQYAVFLRCLIAARSHAGLTQAELARRIGQTQSFVSKCERGARRLDFVEVDAFCKAFGVPLEDFVRTYAGELAEDDRDGTRVRP